MAKIDKEALIKHHFWILLGVFVPLVLLTLILLWTSVAAVIAEKHDTLTKVKEEVKGISKPNIKNELWLAVLQKKEQGLLAQKNKVWQQAWEGQASEMLWPKFLVDAFPVLAQRSFGTPLVEAELRDKYLHDKERGYAHQINELVELARPVNEKGEGVVQFKEGWKNVIRHVEKWATSLPSSEEIWLAQEEIWVQRSLLLAVREANDHVALCKKEPAPKPDETKGELDHQVFSNPLWKLELVLTADKLRYQITNLGSRQMAQGINFVIRAPGGKLSEKVFVDGVPLAPNQSDAWKEIPFRALGFKSLDSLEQVLDWRSAPVKRIDRIELGFSAHRFASIKPQAAPAFKEDKSGAAPAGGQPGVPPQIGEGLQPATGAAASTNVNSNKTESGLERNRYLDVNQQVRRLGVGIVLIVDQAHIQDVLTSFANSKLRFQITQVHWQHYRGPIKPTITDEPVPGKPKPGAKGEAIGAQPGAEAKGPQASSAGDEEASNLIELAVYGIASLYQKFDPKAGAAAPGAPAGEAPPANPELPPQ